MEARETEKNIKIEVGNKSEIEPEVNEIAQNNSKNETKKKKLTMQEVVELINGKDEKNKANAAVTLESYLLHVNKTLKNTGSVSCHKPVVNLKKRGKYIEIDLNFFSALDNDLKMMWAMLETHGQKVTELTNDSVEIPVISLTMVPVSQECKYYAVASNPIFWTLQPEKPGYEAKVLRMVFEAVNLVFYESEGIDLDLLAEEVEREEANK